MTAGRTDDCKPALDLSADLETGAILLADKAYDTADNRNFAEAKKAWANIPSRKSHKGSFVFNKWLYRQRNLVEFFLTS